MPGPAAAPPVVEKREFWVLIGYAVAAAAGVVAGLLRRLTRLPAEIPGVFDELQAEHADLALVPGTVAASVVSLIGGSSVGRRRR
jgi:hypothetical protein